MKKYDVVGDLPDGVVLAPDQIQVNAPKADNWEAYEPFLVSLFDAFRVKLGQGQAPAARER